MTVYKSVPMDPADLPQQRLYLVPDLGGAMTTSLRCREGDLAIIIREEPGCEVNIGCAVIVHSPLWQNPDTGPDWVIVPANNHALTFIELDGRIVCQQVDESDRIIHPDAWLIPITPRTDEETGCADKEVEDAGYLESVT